ncbi:RNA polymerase sigma factor [Chitinophaga nivalis]|uniref:Sigma-70 family RNA polymerase sigma factor n=1 Tax=Chitinophaga nivalis TaxID=2991709 RepID=A0ABT3IS41_9BACT|nr:sigma-70 family RNA polymerase sigma factor [Chitinophaga nivalis]MCW3463526.1 sigma-70 family RNA polymerase sigma factor [Chitinophaga nivalis]MCW3486784.1 sigma-70 family RNA polymerase sigma factor [Chitinophaga nivalis]
MDKTTPVYSFEEDRLLLEQITSGNYAAFTALYNKYIKGLHQYGLKFTADTTLVEDSLHDLFVWIWARRQELSIQTSLKSYLIKALRTSLLRRLKEAQRTISRDTGAEDHYDFRLTLSPETEIMDKENEWVLRDKVARLLAQLTNRQKEVIYLRYYEGLSFEEIAGNMNLTMKGCYKLMGRAIATLRELGTPVCILIYCLL